ncbi:MAG: glucose-6-phosphate dehydrogenase [Anaerolineae bacterium]|jgi:glucose-6-phosphate 1-dehydrogenase|nr:glucose-6-phosphate dehydrogenase [Anaerolineae bacterium]
MEHTSALVIFGASGDLTRRKLIPSLYKLFIKGRLPENLEIIGFARRDWDDDHFRNLLQEGVQQFSTDQHNTEKWALFAQRVHYFKGNLDVDEDFLRLKQYLFDHFGEKCQHYFYLATSPNFFKTIIGHLANCGAGAHPENLNRIIIEKPFGTDRATAVELNQFIHSSFKEDQIYRIDHYLGKETAQNILFFRFSNTIFEPIWNRNYIDHVQITVAETVDVGYRAGYYDEAGILRDMFQNHIFQLLALTAMEAPNNFNAIALRNEKVKVLFSIPPLALENVVLGQYEGYQETDRVAPDSRTATFAAMKVFVNNWRWQGVPFYLRSGKAMAQKTSEISIYFRHPPHNMFAKGHQDTPFPNVLSIIIQPNEGIHLSFATKQPDSYRDMQAVNMNFYYRDNFGAEPLPDAYERLLLDALHGDASLFARADEIERSWELIDPVIRFAEDPTNPPPIKYEKGSWGPPEAVDLIEPNGGCWLISHGESGIMCTI